MAYTPSKEVKALLQKSREAYKTGWKPSAEEQAILTQHSKRMVEDMAPKVNTGGGGAYDYGSGTTTGGYGYGMDQPYKSYVATPQVEAILKKHNSGQQLTPQEAALYEQHFKDRDTALGMQQLNPNDLAEGYQNFLQTQQRYKAAGLPPPPMPVQFAQIARQMGGGMGVSSVSGYQTPTKGSAGFNNMVTAGLIDGNGNPVMRAQASPGNVYGQPNPTQPQINPTTIGSNPTQVATNPTATLPFNPDDALQSAPVTIRTPNGGIALGNSVAGIDEGKLLAEAELQKNLRKNTYEQQVAGRKAMLDELSGVLQKQQQAMLNDQMPGIYEDLNTRGLLRSTGLGEKVGLEASKLARQTSEELAKQGIMDRNAAINDLGTIEENYLGGRGSAIQRRFSLEDFDRQVAAGVKLGINATPSVSQPSGKGSGALQGGLGGATVGASVGGPAGAIIGGTVGAIGGGKLGSK